MSRYFSGAPKSGGPAKTSKFKVAEQPGAAGHKVKGNAPFSKGPDKIGEIEVASSDGPAKRTRAERQSDRDDKKTTRRAKRADKRIKRKMALKIKIHQ